MAHHQPPETLPRRPAPARTPGNPRLLHHHGDLLPTNPPRIHHQAPPAPRHRRGPPLGSRRRLTRHHHHQGHHLVRLHPDQNDPSPSFSPRLQNRRHLQHPLPPLPLHRLQSGYLV